MVLSVDKNFLFIHIPKTGGSSLEEVLFQYKSFEYHEVTHAISLQYKDYLDDDFFFSLHKFAFIRNPWDLQVSCWRYYIRQQGVDMSFDEFIRWKFTGSIIHMIDRLPKNEESSIDRLKRAFYVHRIPQTHYLINEKGEYLVDYIASFEKLNFHYEHLVDHLNLEKNYIPKVNVSSYQDEDRDYRKLYTEETKEIVRSRFNLDILMYGYQFEEDGPIEEKIGDVREKNNTIQKRGYEIPTDFYFSFGDIPYGFYDIKSRFTDETSKSEKLLEFERDKANRRIWTLNQNIGVIAEYIENIMEELSENSEDVYLYKKYLKEIQDLREKEIIYIIEIRKIEKALANR